LRAPFELGLSTEDLSHSQGWPWVYHQKINESVGDWILDLSCNFEIMACCSVLKSVQ